MHNSFVKYYLWLALPFFFITGCNEKTSTDQTVAAQAGNKFLYVSDVNDVIPDDLPAEDSITMAEDYINKWIKRQLLVQKAEENLSVDQKDLSRELEEYRNSLIVYRYKNELMRQRMDTTVNEAQILEYYEPNKENFKLNKNIVKAIFVKVPEEFAEPEQLKEWSKNPTDENIIELRDYCVQFAKSYDIFIDKWVDFDIVARNVPTQIENVERFLEQNENLEITESDYYYYITGNDGEFYYAQTYDQHLANIEQHLR